MNNYIISCEKELLQIDAIHTYLSAESYWAKGIPLSTVQTSIDHSLCWGVYHNQLQIGFARVISDYATFAYLADVYILEAHRGKGLSKQLMIEIFKHPELQSLRRWMLLTHDAHEIYRSFGFSSPAFPERIMEISRPNLYHSK
ncbi:MAG: GNAT family N-acetyltransferase [Bacteroidia bacterium]